MTCRSSAPGDEQIAISLIDIAGRCPRRFEVQPSVQRLSSAIGTARPASKTVERFIASRRDIGYDSDLPRPGTARIFGIPSSFSLTTAYAPG